MIPSQTMMTCAASRPVSPKMQIKVPRVSEKIEQFPRSSVIPKQSPVFWVGQKDRYLRQLLIRDIEVLTGRRLLVYYANRFHNAQINQRDCDYFVELFGDVNSEACDLFIETSGGETDATEGLVKLLRTLAPDLRVIVPNAAKSNGTLLSLAAKEIVMGPPSELGPNRTQSVWHSVFRVDAAANGANQLPASSAGHVRISAQQANCP